MATTHNSHTGNNSTTDYSFTFPYLKQTDIKVTLDNVATTAYTFANATTVRFDSAPAADVAIKIYRATDDSKLVATFYPGSAIRSNDLNDNYTQNLYSTQENTNNANEALDNSRVLESGDYVSAITKANNAVATADGAKEDADDAIEATNALVGKKDSSGNWYARGHGSGGTDSQGNASTEDGVGKALADSANAVSTANDADANATTALNNSRESDGSGGYNNAIDIANQADTNATTALSNSRDSEGTSAISIAEDAKTTALAAQTAVSNSTTYNLKSNKTAFEAVTFTAEIDGQPSHKAWEITDSTGITSAYTSFTDNGGSGTAKTVTGVPSGFTGDEGLSARFNYTHSDNTFAWAGYWVNDAEDRYGGSIVQNLREITTDFTLKDTMNGFSIGPITINSAATITIPENSKYVVMN